MIIYSQKVYLCLPTKLCVECECVIQFYFHINMKPTLKLTCEGKIIKALQMTYFDFSWKMKQWCVFCLNLRYFHWVKAELQYFFKPVSHTSTAPHQLPWWIFQLYPPVKLVKCLAFDFFFNLMKGRLIVYLMSKFDKIHVIITELYNIFFFSSSIPKPATHIY